MSIYNGQLSADNTIDFSQWRLLYNQALSGAYVAPVGLPDIAQLNSDYTIALNTGTKNLVNISLINYASIKPTAISDGFMYVQNGQLYDGTVATAKADVINRPNGPYQTNRLFIAASSNNTAQNGVLNLNFNPNLFYTNTGLTIINLEVDFGNGNGFIMASFNTLLSGSYTTIGNKQMIYKITFSDGSIAQCYNMVYVPYIPTTSNASRYGGAIINPITGEDIPDVILNSNSNAHSGVDLFIRRSVSNTAGSNTNPQFRKPLIIVEGLDLSSATTLLGNGYNYNNFLREISDLNQTGFVSGINPLQPFDQYLDDVAGYDLIFVNWHDGVDNILRNVLVLRDVINFVNTHKQAGAEQNVIMGISMGGLVSRYCLAQMVKAGGTGINETQTRLLITHDSPHRGANIPLALQHLLQGLRKQRVKAFLGIYNERLDDIIPQLKDVNTAINSPAATQQLLARVINDDGTVAYNTFLDGDYRTMINFAGTGFTQPYRFVATSNGSQCGVALAAPYSQLASLDAEGKAFFFGLTLWTKGRAYLDMRRLPNSGEASSILDFNLKLKIKFLGFNLLKISMQIQKNAPSTLLPLDGLAGGTRNLGGAVLSSDISTIPSASGGANWLIFGYSFNFSTPYIAPSFSFVPTTSSLDIADFNAVNIPYSIPVTGLNGSRAANYIAQERITLPAPVGVTNNVTHTDFYARTCSWLYNEMENITQPFTCQDYCPEQTYNVITGPRIICNTATYSLSNIPSGATVTWSAGSSNPVFQLVPNANGSQVTITNLHYYSNTATLTATINVAGCSYVGAVTTISTDDDYQQPSTRSYPFTQEACYFYGVNHPAVSGTVGASGLGYIHQGCMVTMDISGITSQGKTVSPPSSFPSGYAPDYLNISSQYLMFKMPLGSGGVPINFTISGPGACYQRTIGFYVISGNGRNTYTASPNPVSDILNVTVVRDAELTKAGAGDYDVKISEVNSNSVLKQMQLKNITNNFKVNLTGLKAGYYAIEIMEGGETQVIKVLKL